VSSVSFTLNLRHRDIVMLEIQVFNFKIRKYKKKKKKKKIKDIFYFNKTTVSRCIIKAISLKAQKGSKLISYNGLYNEGSVHTKNMN
jgi:hypothetical protein